MSTKAHSKAGEPRTIALTEEALAVLRETARASEHVFIRLFRKLYTVQVLRSICLQNLSVALYCLHYAFAQCSLDDGLAPEIVTKTLGHKTSRTVWTYTHIRDEQMAEAASRLRIRQSEAG